MQKYCIYFCIDPEQVMNSWMNSFGHRANILNIGSVLPVCIEDADPLTQCRKFDNIVDRLLIGIG